ncbi:MAG: ATP synthase F1 subunit epsilon [Armatimonadetes bacterium]|nr:ATP synthase F1 subunit epsilon [Armatimonadota bacterium]
MATFQLRLVTPDAELFGGPVVSVRLPGVMGSFGVRAGHAPLMTALTVGSVVVTHENGDTELIASSGGFVEVSRSGVTVLADAAERGKDIDVTRAEQAIGRARAQLESGEAVDYDTARAALDRAMNRLKVAQQASDDR